MTSVYTTGTQVSGRTSNRNVAHSEHVCDALSFYLFERISVYTHTAVS